MMKTKVLKTKKEHAAAVAELESLMLLDLEEGSAEDERYDLLTLLIKDWEDRNVKLPEVSREEVIRFCMEQQGLAQKDLVPYIGSKSRVSEVLSGKRDLTLKMVRALHGGLGVPLHILIKEPNAELPPEIDTTDYPRAEMAKRGYFKAEGQTTWAKIKDRAEEVFHEFFRGRQDDLIPALNKQTSSKKSKIDHFAVHAWRCRVLDLATTQKRGEWRSGSVNDALVNQLKGFSTMPTGPLVACDRLRALGIAVVIEEQLPKTLLDGAALWHPDGYPVIGLTLRHNRLDNFWFCLFHELAHVKLHLDGNKQGFIDADIDSGSEQLVEHEADRFALDNLISPDQWGKLEHLTYAKEIKDAATELQIHPAIIAGRLRRANKDYRKHRTLIGQGDLKPLFGIQDKKA